MSRVARRGSLTAGAVLSAGALFAGAAQAQTFTVNNLGDPTDTNNACTADDCTLRAAITQADNDATSPSDTINFAPGLSGTIDLSSTLDMNATIPVTITGAGASITIDGQDENQIFEITSPDSGSVELDDLTMAHGFGDSDHEGGAIGDLDGAPLSLNGDSISDSASESNTIGGGGVFAQGPLTVTNSTITGNSATAGHGGGIAAKYGATITDSTIEQNSSSSQGGGLYLESSPGSTISDSTIQDNTAAMSGGGLSIQATSPGGATGSPAPVSIVDSTFSANKAPLGAGVELAREDANAPVTIQSSTISGNDASGPGGPSSFGGGLLVDGYVQSPFHVIDSTISGNDAGHGAGVSLSHGGYGQLLENGGSITFDNSTIAANTASVGGGGIYLGDYTDDQDSNRHSGTATINSTIVGANSPDDLARASTNTEGGFGGAFDLVQKTTAPATAPPPGLIARVDPQLGPLNANGGQTQTMLPARTSPVVDKGQNATGATTDQRGDARTFDSSAANAPGGDGTDIGAVELTAAELAPPIPPSRGSTPPTRGKPAVLNTRPTVRGPFTTLFGGTVNPEGLATTVHFEYGLDPKYNGGGPIVYDSSTPTQAVGADFTAHALSILAAGLVPNAKYHVRMIASNSAGTVTGADQTFTTNREAAPPPPVIGSTENVIPVSGLVFVKPPPGQSLHLARGARVVTKGKGFVPLTQARQVPLGSQIDARRGTLNLIVAAPQKRHTQTARLSSGLFTGSQIKTGRQKGLTTFTLKEGAFTGAPSYASCTVGKKKSAHTAGVLSAPLGQVAKAKLSSKILQTLKASDSHGKFRTKGRYSAATVRGTQWATSDRCDGTLTKVTRGSVNVLDFTTRKTVIVRAGHSFLARAVAAKKAKKKHG